MFDLRFRPGFFGTSNTYPHFANFMLALGAVPYLYIFFLKNFWYWVQIRQYVPVRYRVAVVRYLLTGIYK
jgi:hypothetical protein